MQRTSSMLMLMLMLFFLIGCEEWLETEEDDYEPYVPTPLCESLDFLAGQFTNGRSYTRYWICNDNPEIKIFRSSEGAFVRAYFSGDPDNIGITFPSGRTASMNYSDYTSSGGEIKKVFDASTSFEDWSLGGLTLGYFDAVSINQDELDNITTLFNLTPGEEP